MVRKSQPAHSVSITASTSSQYRKPKSTATKPRAAKEIDRSWKKSQVQRAKPLKTSSAWPFKCLSIKRGSRSLSTLKTAKKETQRHREHGEGRKQMALCPLCLCVSMGLTHCRCARAYRPVGSTQVKSMTLTAQEFMRRFLQHVLPSGFRKVRHYGLASARSQVDLELLKWLVTVTLHMVYVLTVCERAAAIKPAPKCQHCGGPLKLYGFMPPATGGYDTS